MKKTSVKNTQNAQKISSNASTKRGGTVIEALDLELLRCGDGAMFSEPIESVERKFRNLFPDAHEHATISLYLQIRLDDWGESLPSRDRMLCFFLLKILACDHTLVEQLVLTTSFHEKLFLLRLLLRDEDGVEQTDLYKESIDQQLQLADIQSRLGRFLTDSRVTTKLTALEHSLTAHRQTDSLRGLRASGLSPVVCSPLWTTDPNIEGAILRDRSPESTLLRFEPRFERPVPPTLDTKNECLWINPHTLPVQDPRMLLCWCPLTMDDESEEPVQQKRGKPQTTQLPAPQSILDTITALRRQQQEEEGGRSRARKIPVHRDDDDDVDDEHVREVYDDDEDSASNRVKDADYYKELFSAAFTRQIKPAQEEDLIRYMQKQASIVRGRLSPTRLPDLVHNNPRIATQALLVQRKSGNETQDDENGDSSALWDDYMGVLVDVRPVTVNSMEVVNGLLKERCMDRHHLHAFIRNGIQSCENVPNDRSGERQSRLVRMVCVFVQALLRTKVLDISENGLDNGLLIDLRPFCVQFAKIKEATLLYKLLDQSTDHKSNQLGG